MMRKALMNEEIMRKNAEEYYDKLGNITIEVEGEPNSIVEAHIAGAQSRNAEVEFLENELKKLSVLLEKNGLLKFANLNNQLECELFKLRHPWKNVSDSLPEHKKPIIFKCADKSYGGWYNKEMEEFQTKAPDGTDWAMNGVTMWYYQL